MPISDYLPIFYPNRFFYTAHSTLMPVIDFSHIKREYDITLGEWTYKTLFDDPVVTMEDFFKARRALFSVAFGILANKQNLPKKFCSFSKGITDANASHFTNGDVFDSDLYTTSGGDPSEITIARQEVPITTELALSSLSLKDFTSVTTYNSPTLITSGNSEASKDLLFEMPDEYKIFSGLINHSSSTVAAPVSTISIYSDQYEDNPTTCRFVSDSSSRNYYIGVYRLGKIIQAGYNEDGKYVMHILNEHGFYTSKYDMTTVNVKVGTHGAESPSFIYVNTGVIESINAEGTAIIIIFSDPGNLVPSEFYGYAHLYFSVEVFNGSSLSVVAITDGSFETHDLITEGSVDPATYNDVTVDTISGFCGAGSGQDWLPVNTGGASITRGKDVDMYYNVASTLVRYISSDVSVPSTVTTTHVKSIWAALYAVDWVALGEATAQKARTFNLLKALNVWDSWLIKASIGGLAVPRIDKTFLCLLGSNIYIMDRLKCMQAGQVTAAESICQWIPRDENLNPVTNIIGLEGESVIHVVTTSKIYMYDGGTWCLRGTKNVPSTYRFYLDGSFWREKASSDANGLPTVESTDVFSLDPDTSWSEVNADNLEFWEDYEVRTFKALDAERKDYDNVLLKRDQAKFNNGWIATTYGTYAIDSTGDKKLYPELITGISTYGGNWAEGGGVFETEFSSTYDTDVPQPNYCHPGTIPWSGWSNYWDGTLPNSDIALVTEKIALTGPYSTDYSNTLPLSYEGWTIQEGSQKSAYYLYDVDNHSIYEPVDTARVSYGGEVYLISDAGCSAQGSLASDDGYFTLSLSISGDDINSKSFSMEEIIDVTTFLNQQAGYKLTMTGNVSVTVPDYTDNQPTCEDRKASARAASRSQSMTFYRLQDLERPTVHGPYEPSDPAPGAIVANERTIKFSHSRVFDNTIANGQNNRVDRLFPGVKDYLEFIPFTREFRVDRASYLSYPFMRIYKNSFDIEEFYHPLIDDTDYNQRAAELLVVGESITFVHLFDDIVELLQYDSTVGTATLNGVKVSYSASKGGSDCLWLRMSSGGLAVFPIFVIPGNLLTDDDQYEAWKGRGCDGSINSVPFLGGLPIVSETSSSITVVANSDVDWTFNKIPVTVDTSTYDTTGIFTVTCPLGHGWFCYLAIGHLNPYVYNVKKYVMGVRVADDVYEFNLSNSVFGLPTDEIAAEADAVRVYVEDVVCHVAVGTEKVTLLDPAGPEVTINNVQLPSVQFDHGSDNITFDVTTNYQSPAPLVVTGTYHFIDNLGNTVPGGTLGIVDLGGGTYQGNFTAPQLLWFDTTVYGDLVVTIKALPDGYLGTEITHTLQDVWVSILLIDPAGIPSEEVFGTPTIVAQPFTPPNYICYALGGIDGSAFDSDSYLENGRIGFNLGSGLNLSKVTVSFDWVQDDYPEESAILFESPNTLVDLANYGFDPFTDGHYEIELTNFVGEDSAGEWILRETDSFGDGGGDVNNVVVCFGEYITPVPIDSGEVFGTPVLTTIVDGGVIPEIQTNTIDGGVIPEIQTETLDGGVI